MRPEFTYRMLVDFVTRLAAEDTVYPHRTEASTGNDSQQLRSMIDHVWRLENNVLIMGKYVAEARNMIHKEGYRYGSLFPASKTNTLTVK